MQGKFQTIQSNNVMTTAMIVERIIANRAKFMERNAKKEKKELSYIQSSAEKAKAAQAKQEEK